MTRTYRHLHHSAEVVALLEKVRSAARGDFDLSDVEAALVQPSTQSSTKGNS